MPKLTTNPNPQLALDPIYANAGLGIEKMQKLAIAQKINPIWKLAIARRSNPSPMISAPTLGIAGKLDEIP